MNFTLPPFPIDPRVKLGPIVVEYPRWLTVYVLLLSTLVVGWNHNRHA